MSHVESVVRVQDTEGQTYIIPKGLKKLFEDRLESINSFEKLSEEWYQEVNKLDYEFGDYMS